jgi:hypothetical protein
MLLFQNQASKQEEEEWDKITSSPESQRFLDHMLQKVDDSIAKGDVCPDPTDVFESK